MGFDVAYIECKNTLQGLKNRPTSDQEASDFSPFLASSSARAPANKRTPLACGAISLPEEPRLPLAVPSSDGWSSGHEGDGWRNRVINSAYAQLWRLDNPFEWAGLAASASKQVGCGLLHAAQSIEKIQTIYEAAEQLRRSARKGVLGLFSAEERERLATLREYERRLRDHEQASRNNPRPDNGARRVGRPSVSRPPHSPTPLNGVPGYEV